MNTIQNKLSTIATLQDIAKSLRERQELIESKLKKFQEVTADLLGDGIEQGKELALAKAKLGRAIKWSDWLAAHVPNITEVQAAKYGRLATEDITDLRQAVFAFLTPAEVQDTAKRLPPAEWEKSWGYLRSLERIKFNAWPSDQQTLAKERLESVAKNMGGKVVWS